MTDSTRELIVAATTVVELWEQDSPTDHAIRMLRDVLQRVNAEPEMLDALRAIREWLLMDAPIQSDGIWNENFVKANNLTHAAITKVEGKDKTPS